MIVWLASYPRSGNTLLRMILSTYFNQKSFSKYNDSIDIAADPDLADAVGHKQYEGSWQGFYKQKSQSTKLYFIKTHDRPENDNKAIYVVRDGRAAAASYLNYLSKFSKLSHDLPDVVSGAVSFGSWDSHLDSWKPETRPNTLLLRYEELVSNPETQVLKIAKFLDMDISDGELPKFDQLKNQFPKFFPTGGNEKNIETISRKELDHLMSKFGPWLKQLGYVDNISYDALTAKSISLKHNQKVLSIMREMRDLRNARATSTFETSLQNFKQTISQELSEKMKFVEHASLAFTKKIDQSQQEITSAFFRKIETFEFDLQKVQSELQSKQTSHEFDLQKVQSELQSMQSSHEFDLQKVQSELQSMQSSQIDREALTEISHRYVSELEGKTQVLQTDLQEAERDVKKKTERIEQLSLRIHEFARTHDAMLEKLHKFSYVLEPRFKAIFELRPIKHILDGRKKVKANGGILPLDVFEFSSAIAPEVKVEPAKVKKQVQPVAPKQYKLPLTPSFNPVEVKEPLGIAVYTYDRKNMVHNVLESLAQQDVLDKVNVWIDGDQGNPKRRKIVDETEALVRQYPVKKVWRNRGNYGFRKMMLTSQRYMLERYEKIIFLEDDCFPCDMAVEDFSKELDAIKNDPSIFSVYGHPFLVPGEGKDFGRFQGWGWATTSEKLEPILKELLSLYLLTEEEYLSWVNQHLTPAIIKKIDVTPGRSPVQTITKFFAWDEMTCMLTAMKNQTHKRSDRRLIYNCGVGESSAHFSKISEFTKPPFNMVSPENIWDYF